MKKYLLFLLLFVVFASCEREEFLPNEPEKPFTDEPSQHDDLSEESDEGTLTLYNVDGDKITKAKDYKVEGRLLEYQQDAGRHAEIWDFVTRLLPPAARGKIAEFEIFYGYDELLGYVAPVDPTDLSRWRFALAIESAGDLTKIDFSELFTSTVIHEYAHILTLSDEQVRYAADAAGCDGFFTGEGCSNSTSYINQLYNLGWTDIYANHDEDNPQDTYARYPNRFVSEYAATNPGEDIAESFSFFITQTSVPSGNSIADQKVKLFYQFPELVAMRDAIRAAGEVNGLSPISLGSHRGFAGKRIGKHRH